MNKFEQFSQENKEEAKKIIVEEFFGSKLSEEEIKERRKIVEEVEVSQRNRKEYRDNISAIKEKIKNGELITSVEAGLLRAEEIENVEEEIGEEMTNLLKPEANKTEQKETEKPKKETFISEKIASEALKNFNINKDELEALEGFGELSEGQQKIVLQNLRQISFGMGQVEAAEKFNKDNEKRGFFSKLLNNIVGTGKLKMAKLERESAVQLEKKGLNIYKEDLFRLTKGMKEFGPEVENEKQINYISEKEFGSLNFAQKEVLKKYNDVAAEYSKLPEEYGFESSNKKDKRNYDEMTAKYKQAQENILPLLKEFYGEESKAMLRVNKADFGVKMNQFITNHPDVEKQLEKIKDNRWWKVLGKSFSEKGAYGLVGAAARHATIGAFGYIGAPIAAAGMGAWLAYRRTKEEIIKKETLGRKGVKDESKTAKNFVKADTLVTNFDRTIRKIKEESEKPAPDEFKLKELKESLALRVKYTTDKLDKGLVDFGATEAQISKTAEEREESEKRGLLGNRYFLVEKLSEAMVIDSDINTNEQSGVGEKLYKFLEFQEKRISKAEEKHLIYQTLKGAGIAAAFAGGGYLLRHFAGQWFGWDKKTTTDLETGVETKNTAPRGRPAIKESYPQYKPSNTAGLPEFEEIGYKPAVSSEQFFETSNKPNSFPTFDEVGGVKAGGGGVPGFEEIVIGAKESIPIKEELGKILGTDIDNVVFKKGIHRIKDFGEKGFSLILKKAEDGSVKFGVDGPTALSRYNWGAEGKSWLFKADADFNIENVSKAKEFIKKAASSFYDYEKAVKKSEGEGIFS